MKLNITVEIDYIDEEGNIDDEVKASIIQGVKDSISKTCLARVEKEASESINTALISAQQKIEERAIQFVEEWLTKEVVITDKWGDVKDTGTITDMIKASFNDILTKTVDSKGRFANGYDAKTTLLEWVTKDRVQEVVANKLEGLNKEIDKKIDELVNAGIRSRVSDKFAEMVIETARTQHNEKPLELDSN